MLHVKASALRGTAIGICAPETKEDNSAALMAEVKKAMESLGKDFEEFKSANDLRIKDVEKKGSADVILREKVDKIGKSLDDMAEAKTKLEKQIEAEKKEREELELRLQRKGLPNTDEGKAALELKTFNDTMASVAAARSSSYAPMDAEGYAAYKRSLQVYLRKGERHPDFDMKTMLVGSDPDGGYFVTPDLGGQIAKKVFETSDIRSIASSQTIGTDALEGIEDTNEAGAGYAGESSQGSDTTTPQVGKWRIPVYWIDTEPKTTQQVLDDANIDIEAWLGAKVGNKIGRFENAEFVTGTKNIRGFTSYTNTSDSGSGVTWGQIGYYPSGAAGAFASSNPWDALISLVGILKNAYLANARWVTRRSVITQIRAMKDGQGRYLWEPSMQAGTPEMILGYPVLRAEDMPAIAANSYSLAFGDFRQAYQIVDRTGIRVLRDPYTSKPYVKFYTTKRTGGAVINFEAIKLMKFAVS